MLKSQVNFALALLSVFYPAALGMRTISGHSSVLCAGVTEDLQMRNSGLHSLAVNLINLYRFLDELDHNFNRLF